MTSMQGGTGIRGPSGKTGSKTKGYDVGQIQKYGPELMQLFQEMMGHAGPDSFTSRLANGDESAFEEMERPALRQFGEVQGQLGSRFSGMGMGAQKSSGFQNTMNSAASNFAQDLQSKRTGLRNQAIKDLMSMSTGLMQNNPYETTATPKSVPWWQSMLTEFGSSFAKSAGQKLGSFGGDSGGGGGGGGMNASQAAMLAGG